MLSFADKNPVYKKINATEIITFPSVRHFIEYDGHSNRSGSFSKAKNKIWFKERYEIISIESVTTKERYTELKQQFKLDENKAEK